MIKSMTGFAAVSVDGDVASVDATLRTVNHRFLDLHLRVPHALAAAEPTLRSLVQARIVRGRAELTVAVERRRPARVEVRVNDALLEQLARAVEVARARGLVDGTVTPGDMLRFPQAVSLDEQAPDPEEASAVVEAVSAAVSQAVEAVEQMRVTEGAHLRAELDGRLEALARFVDRAEAMASDGAERLRQRLTERVEALTSDTQVDAAHLAQEVVKFVARSDITEELVRLRGHVGHWKSLCDGPEPCGRTLEFLLQEMNREVNTLGAKAEGPGVSELVVAAKAELEKLREQVQNVE